VARPDRSPNASFLLAQLGAHAAARFAERLAAIDLTPPDAGVLRLVGGSPAISQRALGDTLGISASRLVALLDRLEARGLVERRDDPDDRRSYALHLTAGGQRALRDIAAVARAHDDAVCAALSAGEREQLRELLRRVADQQGLTPGVHPGYRKL
jgi:DNA-binding MarR family transcriptional regulator